MDHTVITKNGWPNRVAPNIIDYDAARASFSWADARRALDGLPGGGLNMAYEAVGRHASGLLADRIAIHWIGRSGASRDLTFAGLSAEACRFAQVLRSFGLERGERVFALLGRVPELYVTALGTLAAGNVLCPLFSAFGPEPIRQRLERGNGRVLVTTSSLYRRKIAALREHLPELTHVLVVGGDAPPAGTISFDAAMYSVEPGPYAETAAEDMALLHFTSGTTGTPKGAVHVHEAVVAHHATAASALDLHPDDIVWCTADPGWVTGTSYGIIAPLTHGVTMIVDESEFDAEHWYSLLEQARVTVWYTAPTALRMLMGHGDELARRFDLSHLRFVASVGEPLNPEVVRWGEHVLGLPIHDNWWQTETGGIMIANLAGCEIRPGSMGRPLPGIAIGVLAQGPDGRTQVTDGKVTELTEPGQVGELALRSGWPSMFRGYLHDDARYDACFAGGWYLTGDVARIDVDGYVWFVGRADDVIKSAGHLIGPFEVESTLMEHPAVLEAGVIGVPEPTVGEVVKAFVTLRSGFEASEALRLDLIGFCRTRLGAAIAPRQIAFDQNLPKTKSGKVMRRLLKARELGLPTGDVSTLEVQQ